eukprot:scaffold55567_cov28-Tisochrysis_lutea.AAC.4
MRISRGARSAALVVRTSARCPAVGSDTVVVLVHPSPLSDTSRLVAIASASCPLALGQTPDCS